MDAMIALAPRIRSKIRVSAAGCWIWTGALNDGGYGRVRDGRGVGGRTVSAHRFVYTEIRGPISSDLTVDHLCGIRPCVNPEHLEPVSLAENLRRALMAPATVNAAKTHCVNGHESTEVNTARDADGRRECRQCKRERALASYHHVRGQR